MSPDLWNLIYDALLRLEMPPGTGLVGFADNVALAATARTEGALRHRIEWAIQRVVQWLKTHGLELAAAKTEMVIPGKGTSAMASTIEGATITTSPSARYLGIWIDTRLTFNDHQRRARHKASNLLARLGRMMPNIARPSCGQTEITGRCGELDTLVRGGDLGGRAGP